MSNERKEAGAVGLLEGPLTARSVVLSLLLGRHPARARVALLVRWCGLFGVTENAARVALSRMVERGELTTHEGVYELAGRLRHRQREQDVALSGPPAEWTGTWHLVVLAGPARPAPERAALRAALVEARLAEVREGVWTRPDNLALPPDARRAGTAEIWSARPADPTALTERLFGIATVAERGQVLLAEIRAVTEDPTDLARAFVVGAAVLQHLRRDPLLPADLLAPTWPGDDLRRAYGTYQQSFSAALAAWFREG